MPLHSLYLLNINSSLCFRQPPESSASCASCYWNILQRWFKLPALHIFTCNRSLNWSFSLFCPLSPRHSSVCGLFVMRFAFVSFHTLTLTVFCCLQAALLSILLSPSLILGPLRSYVLLINVRFFIFPFQVHLSRGGFEWQQQSIDCEFKHDNFFRAILQENTINLRENTMKSQWLESRGLTSSCVLTALRSAILVIARECREESDFVNIQRIVNSSLRN